MDDIQDTVVRADCVKWLRKWRQRHSGEPGFADLIFADPPFNIGYKYDVYEDRKAYDEYYDWTRQWMSACRDVLKPDGTFWIAIGDEYAAEVRMIGRDLDLHLRNWVIWHYTFGQNTKKKFARAHTHLFYFVADPRSFTFADEAVRTLSDRQRVYADKRASQKGKIPDDVWTEFPRVCGTFAEREGWHPCQMPETLLARIVRACSRPGDMVLDPFAGSGTTLVAAKKLNRRYLGIEMSEKYVGNIERRLSQTRRIAEIAEQGDGWPAELQQELCGVYAEMGVTTARLYKHPHLLEAVAEHFHNRLRAGGLDLPEDSAGNGYGVGEVKAQLELLRRQAKLPMLKVHDRGNLDRVTNRPKQELFDDRS
ncbi:MAG: DNA-methyltransferase [Phycisphaerae bacterium]